MPDSEVKNDEGPEHVALGEEAACESGEEAAHDTCASRASDDAVQQAGGAEGHAESGVLEAASADIQDAVRETLPHCTDDKKESTASDSATSTPIPGSGERDGNGNGQNGRPRKPSGDFEMVKEQSPALEAAVKEINRQGLAVEMVALMDGSQTQRDFREHHFNEETWNTIRLFQNADFISDIQDGKDWYDYVSMSPGVYTGGKILMENTALMTLPRKYRKDIQYLLARFQKTPEGIYVPLKDNDGKLVQANIVELAPANGDWIIRLNKLVAGYKLAAVRDKIKLFRKEIKEMIESGQINPSISAIDYASTFVTRLKSKRKINASCADLCDDAETFFGDINLEPNSQDLIGGFIFLDRTQNVEQPIENMRYLARPDDTTKAIIGVALPFESDSDVDSLNPKVKKIKFWDKSGDIRQRWMADIEIENEEFRKLEPAQAVRAQALYNMIMDLNRLGLVVETVAEQPYEVYSPHCVIEPAGVLRAEYQHLRDRHFDDPALQTMHEEVFTDSEKYPDDRPVGYPQIYGGDQKLILLGVRVLAKDGSRFRKED